MRPVRRFILSTVPDVPNELDTAPDELLAGTMADTDAYEDLVVFGPLRRSIGSVCRREKI